MFSPPNLNEKARVLLAAVILLEEVHLATVGGGRGIDFPKALVAGLYL